MTTVTHFVGLDVHKESISIADAARGRDEAKTLAKIPNEGKRLVKHLDWLGPRESISCCYEAGPTGYGLQRYLESKGIHCDVIAPTLIPQKAGDRVKTDKRDAKKLATHHRSGDLTPVWIPRTQTEAIRDLVRARDSAKKDERAARHRLNKFLLRNDRRYAGRAWSGRHLEWIRGQKFEHEAQNRVRREYLHKVESSTEAIDRLVLDIEEMVACSELAPLVKALQALKGVRLITAAGVAAELGDLRRFSSPRKLMAYVGLVSSEYSTGSRRRQFGITKTGNAHVRKLLVEAAWAYQHPPRMGPQHKKRCEGLSPEIVEIAWKAQDRLHRRYRRLCRRGKPKQVVVTCVARELAGFIWSIGQRVDLNH